jgi:hypothetical protein
MFEYILGWISYLLFVYFSLPKKYNSATITSNLVSLTHAILTILGSLYFIVYDNYGDTFSTNKLCLIKISSAYFIYDCLFMIIHNLLFNGRSSIIFLSHHLIILSVYYITTTYDYGSKLVIFTLFWGELTNPLQIIWVLSRYLTYKKIEAYIFPVFSFNFMIIRSMVIPYMNYTIIKSLMNNKYYYPNIGLIILSTLGNIGGFIWIRGIINKLIKLIK